jgi:fatty-acyl-CoA synthase
VTYAGMLRAVAVARQDAPALTFIDRSLDYGELLDGGTRRAQELRALGIGRGDRFGVLLPNCPELIELLLGGAMIGAAPAATLISAYGMTELCGTLAYSHLEDTLEQRLTTCGHLLPSWEARIVDPETGPPVGAGLEGELGLLLFHGRLKDVLKVGGENVSALEVESFLATHPAVKLAQVVGFPDDRYGEVPAAFIEVVPGATVSEAELVDFCDGRIARFKTPRHVRFVTEWPMSSTKVQKFRLRDGLVAELTGSLNQPNNR